MASALPLDPTCLAFLFFIRLSHVKLEVRTESLVCPKYVCCVFVTLLVDPNPCGNCCTIFMVTVYAFKVKTSSVRVLHLVERLYHSTLVLAVLGHKGGGPTPLLHHTLCSTHIHRYTCLLLCTSSTMVSKCLKERQT